MGDARLIFVVGTGRCGTTFLAQRLDEHRDVAALFELHSLAYLLKALRAGGEVDRVGFDALDRENIRTAARPETEYNWRCLSEEAHEFRRAMWRDLDSGMSLADTIRRWADRYHQTQIHRDGARRAVHKTPALAEYLPEIRRIWPDALVLHPIRHPCAVVASYLAQDWGPTTVDDAIVWYVSRLSAAASAGRGSAWYREVAFERLVSEPAELELIADWLRLPVDGWCEPAQPSRPTDRWRTELAPADIERIFAGTREVYPVS